MPCATDDYVESEKITMTLNGVGIDVTETPEQFELFPNPTTGMVTVTALKNNGTVEILDMLGRKLDEVFYQAGKTLIVDLSNLAAGPYTLLFLDKSGKRWHVKVIRE